MIIYAPFEPDDGWTDSTIQYIRDWNYEYIGRSAELCAQNFNGTTTAADFEWYAPCPFKLERVS